MKTVPPTLEEIAEDFLVNLRAGKRPSVNEFSQRNPSISDEVSDLLSSIEMMEQIGELESTARKPFPIWF